MHAKTSCGRIMLVLKTIIDNLIEDQQERNGRRDHLFSLAIGVIVW